MSGGRKAYGGLGISEFELRISEFQKKTDRNLRVGDFEPDTFRIQIRNPNSAIRISSRPGWVAESRENQLVQPAALSLSDLSFAFINPSQISKR